MPATGTSVGKLFVDLLLKDDEFKKGLTAAEGAVKRAGDGMTKFADKVQSSVVGAFKAMGVAATAFGAATVAVGVQFEQQMAVVGAIANATETEFQALTDQARLLGATTEFTATQAAEGLESLARAGMDVKQSIEASQAALLLAGTSGAQLGDSTQLIAASMRQFSLDAEQSTRIVDVFSNSMRNSLFDFASLREAMKFGGTVGAAFGMTIEETTASLEAFRNLGLEGSLAGTNFRMAMTQAMKATDEKVAALDRLGLTMDDINPTLHTFSEIMRSVGEASLNAEDAFLIFGRAGGNIATIAKQVAEETIDLDSRIRDLGQSAGETADMYEMIGQTVSFQTKVAISALQDLMLTVFDQFREPLRAFVSELPVLFNLVSDSVRTAGAAIRADMGFAIETVTRTLRDAAPQMAQTFASAVKAAAEFGAMLVQVLPLLDDLALAVLTAFAAVRISQAAFAIGAFIEAIHGAVVAAGSLKAAIAAVNTTLTVSTGGIFAIVAAIGTLVTGLVLLTKRYFETRNAADELRQAQQRLAASQQAAFDEQVRAAQAVIDQQVDMVGMQIALAEEAGRSTVELRAQLDELKALSAEELAAKRATGELVLVQNELGTSFKSVRDAVDEMDFESIATEISRTETAIASSKDELGELEEALERAGKVSERAGKQLAMEELRRFGAENLDEAQLRVDQLKNTINEAEQRVIKIRQNRAAETKRMFEEETRASEEANQRMTRAAIQASEKIRDARIAARDEFLGIQQQLADELAGLQLDESQQLELALAKRLDEINAAADKELALWRGNAQRIEAIGLERDRAIANAQLIALEKRTELFNREVEEARNAAREQRLTELDLQAELLKIRQGELDAHSDTMQAREVAREQAAIDEAGVQLWLLRKLAELGEDEVELRTAIEEQAQQQIEDIRKRAEEEPKEKPRWLQYLEQAIDVINEIGRAIGRVKGVVDSVVNKLADVVSMMTGATVSLDSLIQMAGEEAEGAPAVDALANAAVQFAENVAQNIDLVVTAFIARLPDVMQAAADAIGPVIQALADNMDEIIKAIADGMVVVAQAIADNLPDLAMAIVENLDVLIVGIIRAAKTLILALIDELPNLIEALLGELPRIIRALMRAVGDVVEALLKAIPDIVIAIVEGIPDIIGAIVAGLPDLIDGIIEGLFGKGGLIERIPEIVLALIEAIIELLPILINLVVSKLPEIVFNLITAVIGMIPRLIAAIVTQLIFKLPEIAFNLVKAILIAVAGSIAELGKMLWEEVLKGVVEFGAQIAVSIWTGIKELFNDFVGFFKDVFNEVLGLFGDLFGEDGWFKKTSKNIGDFLGLQQGIPVIPRESIVRVHPGEAVIPAHVNPFNPGVAARGMAASDRMSGPPAGRTGGAPGQMGPIRIDVMIDGRTVDGAIVRGRNRGTMPELQKMLSQGKGVRMGLDRRKFQSFVS